MRNFTVSLVIAVLVAFATMSTSVNAEAPRTFATPEQATTALCTGEFVPYVWHVRAKHPVQGEDRMTETPMVVEMDTLEGRRFIPVPTGGHLLFEGNKPVGWPGCQNKIWSWKLLSPCPEPVVAKEEAKKLDGLPPTTNIVGSFNTTIVNPPDPGKGTAPPGNWYTRSWKNHPVMTGIIHVVVIGGIAALASGGGGKDKKPLGDGNTIP
jgi:hypothetical protein